MFFIGTYDDPPLELFEREVESVLRRVARRFGAEVAVRLSGRVSAVNATELDRGLGHGIIGARGRACLPELLVRLMPLEEVGDPSAWLRKALQAEDLATAVLRSCPAAFRPRLQYAETAQGPAVERALLGELRLGFATPVPEVVA